MKYIAEYIVDVQFFRATRAVSPEIDEISNDCFEIQEYHNITIYNEDIEFKQMIATYISQLLQYFIQ